MDITPINKKERARLIHDIESMLTEVLTYDKNKYDKEYHRLIDEYNKFKNEFKYDRSYPSRIALNIIEEVFYFCNRYSTKLRESIKEEITNNLDLYHRSLECRNEKDAERYLHKTFHIIERYIHHHVYRIIHKEGSNNSIFELICLMRAFIGENTKFKHKYKEQLRK